MFQQFLSEFFIYFFFLRNLDENLAQALLFSVLQPDFLFSVAVLYLPLTFAACGSLSAYFRLNVPVLCSGC